jgi:hypothetical protein
MSTTKCSSEGATLLTLACANVKGFADMHQCFKKGMGTSGRSTSTLNNYAMHLAKIALHFKRLPLELEDAFYRETVRYRMSIPLYIQRIRLYKSEKLYEVCRL